MPSWMGLFLAVGLAVVPVAPMSAQTAQRPAEADAKAEAYRLFLYARYLEGEDDLDGAIRSYREAADLDPDTGEILGELAALYARQNRSEESVATAREALERDAGNLTAHRILGLIYANRASGQDASPEDAATAIDHLEQARRTILPDFQVELGLARLYLVTDATDQAVALLEELLKDQMGMTEAGLLLAEAYQQMDRVDDAIATLEGVVQGGRPSARALTRLGQLYEEQGRWREAAGMYERSVARNPRGIGARRRLANALLEDGQAEGAREVLRELVTIRPEDAAGLYLLSQVELGLGNFDEAERVARQLVDAEPAGIRGAYALSEVFARQRQHQRVVDTLKPVLDAARRRDMRVDQIASLLGRLGFAYEQLGSYGEATDAYEEAVELLPDNLAFEVRLAQVYVASDRPAEAMTVVRRARTRHPTELTLARLEAELLGEEGDVDAGVDVLQDALSANTREPMAYVVLADFYSTHDRVDDAVELLESAEGRFPSDVSIPFQLGAVFEQHDRHVDAERAFRRVLDRDPAHAATLNYLGYMLADRGERLDESVTLLERAIEIDPDNGAYLDSLGWAYLKLDRLDLAETHLRRASEQLLQNSVIQDHLGDLMSRLGRYGEAISAWERALAGDREEIEPATIEQKIRDARREVR